VRTKNVPAIATATAAFHTADSIWQAALEATFGSPSAAVGARYSPAGHGELGSPLRTASEARRAAQERFTRAWQEASKCQP
jgi:hypothetical protein